MQATAATPGALRIEQLVKEYRPGAPVLQGIDLTIDGTGLTGIIGPSGTGKSTLIRCINRLVTPSAGRILLHLAGEEVDMAQLHGRALRRARRHIGMVFQEYNLVERLTVMENVLTGRLGYLSAWRAWRRRFDAADIERALALLQTVGLAAFAGQRADALSGGQRQRVGIARALMQQPSVLLADEPTSSLDPKTSVEIVQLLREQGVQRGIPVIVNIHDVELARRYCDRIIGMTGGRVVYDGAPDGLTDGHLQTIYGGQGWLP
ncbi:phosphonate transport system ATP-binding protein [Oryzisolibacter propanilivorax]|uniref:Phosphonate transport system ATP-binding protein n=1 Tax=Oryzisolibacter propanilivorax TaxID=1527607 RepID=A0A1G9Q233_9BURK|nr:phosphonate ABC transporter ATP-binding protein [Oryzisolibacter propanilivorax]SDM04993.1 phosphonate transport system ATP-binding protein [Oryzisolibacter propanilivorax]